jgi:hypothetical protein
VVIHHRKEIIAMIFYIRRNFHIRNRAGSGSGNVLDTYSRGTEFEYRSVHRLF